MPTRWRTKEEHGPRKARIQVRYASRTARALRERLKARRARRSVHLLPERITFDALCASLGRSAAMRRFDVQV
jgi:hypothetical protein